MPDKIKTFNRRSNIGLESADLAIKRVKKRVEEGGHGIDEATVRKRYEASLSMLKEVMPLCNAAVIYDNTKKLDMIASFDEGKWTLLNKNCGWFNRAMPEVLKMERIDETMGERHDKPEHSMKNYMAEIERMKKDNTGHSDGFSKVREKGGSDNGDKRMSLSEIRQMIEAERSKGSQSGKGITQQKEKSTQSRDR